MSVRLIFSCSQFAQQACYSGHAILGHIQETILTGEPRLDDSLSVPLSPGAQRTILLSRHRLL